MALGELDSRKRVAPAAVLAFLSCARPFRLLIREEYCRLKLSWAARLRSRIVGMLLGGAVVANVEQP